MRTGCVLIVMLLTGLFGCRSSAPRAAPQPAPADRSSVPPRPQPAPHASTRPAPPTGQPPAKGQPASRPAFDAEPVPLPRYVTILRNADVASETRLDVRVEPPRTIRIDTFNVQRFLITRRELPLPRGESLVLRVDAQVFEWTPHSHTLILQHSPSRGWYVARRIPERP